MKGLYVIGCCLTGSGKQVTIYRKRWFKHELGMQDVAA